MRPAKVEPPVTLITGTRKGIGRFLAEHYVGRGHLVIGCSRKPSSLEADGYTHYCVDVAEEGDVGRMLRAVRRDIGRLDHLVNNAGVASLNHSLLTPMSTVRRVMETNVLGTFLLCREAAKIMKRKGYGRIVNFTTVAVPLKLEGEAAYAASKAAVESLTETLAREFAPFGISVNAVGPSPLETDLLASVPAETIDRLIARQAIHRFATFQDVANVVDFYLRPESGFVTGQTLYLGGV